MSVLPPSWDLEVVFRAFCGDDYEPMANLFLQALTKKLFLLALATVVFE